MGLNTIIVISPTTAPCRHEVPDDSRFALAGEISLVIVTRSFNNDGASHASVQDIAMRLTPLTAIFPAVIHSIEKCHYKNKVFACTKSKANDNQTKDSLLRKC